MEDFKALEGVEDHRAKVHAEMIRSLDRNNGWVLSAPKTQGDYLVVRQGGWKLQVTSNPEQDWLRIARVLLGERLARVDGVLCGMLV